MKVKYIWSIDYTSDNFEYFSNIRVNTRHGRA